MPLWRTIFRWVSATHLSVRKRRLPLPQVPHSWSCPKTDSGKITYLFFAANSSQLISFLYDTAIVYQHYKALAEKQTLYLSQDTMLLFATNHYTIHSKFLLFHCSCHSSSFTIASNTGSRNFCISSITTANSRESSLIFFKKYFHRFCISSASASETIRLKLSRS